MVQLAITIACSKGGGAIGGLIKALEGTRNSQIILALRTWAKEDFNIDIDGDLSEPKEGASAVQSLAIKKLPKNVKCPTGSSLSGTKLIDKITSLVEDDFMEKLQGHLVGKASKILHATEFCTSLVHQNILEEIDIQLTTVSKAQEVELTENAIKAAFSRKAIGSLVVALQSSNNEGILLETYDWLETSQARKKNYPISVKSQQIPTATGIFVATTTGLVSLDLQTSEATALTSTNTLAVALNNNLKKVYWSEVNTKSTIKRSNFDGSAKEVIVPPTDGWIHMLAIDEASGNVYFSQLNSHEITVCSALGENRAAVITNSSLVNLPMGFALNSVNGVMYWGKRGSSSHSLVRANLDGSNARMISNGFRDLRGITLEQSSSDVLYWADYGANTIGNININDGKKRTLVELEGSPGPWGIQVDANKIYISNWLGRNIQSVDKGSGKELTTIFSSTGGVRHLALFSATA